MKAKVIEVVVYTEVDEEPDLSWLEQDCWNEADADGMNRNYGWNRIATYGAVWWMIGIIAKVTIGWDDVWDGDTCVSVGGTKSFEASVWSVESDSDRAHVQEHGENLLGELRAQLDEEPRFTFDQANDGYFDDDNVVWNV